MAKMLRFFENVVVDDVGTEILNIFGAIKYLLTGEIQQVTIRKVSGDDCLVDMQLRYISGNGNLDKLAYLFQNITIDSSGFVDSSIEGPFTCATKGTDGELHLYLQAEAGKQCTLSIRIDFDINNVKGIQLKHKRC